MNDLFGIINVYKEKGITSFDVVAKLRKILKEKKIGHTGTLDPNATGVLPICIGNATKLTKYILSEDKEYIATVKLGIKTDTQDITGKVLEEQKDLSITLEDIDKVCKEFVGKQKQKPPMYSAAKINGKKLYEYARLGVEIERQDKDIEIYSINDIKYDEDNQTVKMTISCSKGTFIRTLCFDIFEKINVLSTLEDLERTKTGIFDIKDCHTIQQIEKLQQEDKIDSILYNIEDLFEDYEGVTIKEESYERFLNGVQLSTKLEDGIYKVYHKEEFTGLGIVENNKLKREFIL